MSTFFYDRLLYPVLRLVGWPILVVYFRGRVKRFEAVPRHGPAILVANHTSLLDGILIHAVTRRPLRIFVAAEWVDWLPVRWFFATMGVIRVQRDRRNPAALESAIAALERGDLVALFPEGGIQTSGRLGPFKNGVARLAYRTGAPIIPCAIVGSFQAMPWPRKLPRPRRITVRSGRAIHIPPLGTKEKLVPEALTSVASDVRSAVRDLLEQGL